MGMFTPIFSKSHNPYELKGRWYKLSVEYDGTIYKLISSDIPINTSGNLQIDGPTILLDPVHPRQELFNLDIIDIVCNLKTAGNGENISTQYVYHGINVNDVKEDLSIKMDYFRFPVGDNENERTPCSFDIYLYAIPHNNHYELGDG